MKSRAKRLGDFVRAKPSSSSPRRSPAPADPATAAIEKASRRIAAVLETLAPERRVPVLAAVCVLNGMFDYARRLIDVAEAEHRRRSGARS